MISGAAWAQSPGANNHQSNAAQAAAVTPAQQTAQAKPTPGAPAPAVKPAQIPGAKAAATAPASSATPKPATAPAKALKPVSASAANRLEGVHVVHNADDIQIEISSREAVTPKVSKLASPARVVVELPSTVMATPQNKIAVGTAGVKGVRIGMDGKTPPTTSVVVDLDRAVGYDLAPGPGNKFFLNLHTAQEAAKNAPAKSSVVAAPKVQIAATKPATTAAAPKIASAANTEAPKATPNATQTKPVAGPNGTKVAVAVGLAPTLKANSAANKAMGPKETSKPAIATTKIAAQQDPANIITKVEAPKPPVVEQKKWAMTGKRDPFFSPVVQQSGGSGCSTGKKCLEIGQINVRGVVKAETGFIAVVTNSMNKAYFLHENDPVFNGFVVKITGDSVVFQETMQDKLGKPFTREVTKRITTPAV
jgi:Tfp pilus assembly protein PilP